MFATQYAQSNTVHHYDSTVGRTIDKAFPPELDRIVQNDVTTEQFAENACNLEIYGRMNAMALETYLQRQSEQAMKCEQDVWVILVSIWTLTT